jgi:hypothetical protein
VMRSLLVGIPISAALWLALLVGGAWMMAS